MSAGTKRNSGGDDDAANDDATIGEQIVLEFCPQEGAC